MSRRSLFALSLALGVLLRPSGALPQTCTGDVPNVAGQWLTLPYLMPINPISATLLHTGGNQLRAAALLGINRNTLRKKLVEHGIEPGGLEA